MEKPVIVAESGDWELYSDSCRDWCRGREICYGRGKDSVAAKMVGSKVRRRDLDLDDFGLQRFRLGT